MPRSRAIAISSPHPLLPLVVSAALIELLAHRILVTALAPPPLGEVTPIYRLLATLAPFFYYFAGLAAIPILLSSTFRFLSFDQDAPSWVKLVLGAAACVFLPLGTVSMAASMQPAPGIPPNSATPLLPYLNLAFIAYLGGMFVLSWSGDTEPRHSVAVTMLLLPILGLAIYRNMLWDSVPTRLAHTEQAKTAVFLVEYGRLTVELAGLWLLFLLAPAPDSGIESNRNRVSNKKLKSWWSRRAKATALLATDPVPLAGGLAVTILLALGAKFRYRITEHLVTSALGISVPTTTAKSLAVLLSSVAFFTLLLALIRSNRQDRARAAGLVLVSVSGFRLDNPLYYMLAAAGLQVLALPLPPLASRSGTHITAKHWKTALASLRSSLSQFGLEGSRIGAADTASGSAASLFGSYMGSNLEIRFQSTKDGRLSAEILIGEIPASRPDILLLVKRSSASVKSPKPRILAISDPDGLAHKILEVGDRIEMSGLRPGRISIWWGIGLRYQVNITTAIADNPLALPFGQIVAAAAMLSQRASILPEPNPAAMSVRD